MDVCITWKKIITIDKKKYISPMCYILRILEHTLMQEFVIEWPSFTRCTKRETL